LIIEPAMTLGMILPEPGYLASVREITRRHGIVLIFDEVKTGLAVAAGGVVERSGSAAARPRPEAPPVTNATLPSKRRPIAPAAGEATGPCSGASIIRLGNGARYPKLNSSRYRISGRASTSRSWGP
jgi:hypothetical protein